MKMDTLDVLPGEGIEKTITTRRVRRACDNCGEPAHYRCTYLLPDARRNPASSAYRRDDCTWSSDLEKFYCAKCCNHGNRWPHQEGYETCSIFPANERFADLFLTWEEKK